MSDLDIRIAEPGMSTAESSEVPAFNQLFDEWEAAIERGIAVPMEAVRQLREQAEVEFGSAKSLVARMAAQEREVEGSIRAEMVALEGRVSLMCEQVLSTMRALVEALPKAWTFSPNITVPPSTVTVSPSVARVEVTPHVEVKAPDVVNNFTASMPPVEPRKPSKRVVTFTKGADGVISGGTIEHKD